MQERCIGYVQAKDFFSKFDAETVLEKRKSAFKGK